LNTIRVVTYAVLAITRVVAQARTKHLLSFAKTKLGFDVLAEIQLSTVTRRTPHVLRTSFVLFLVLSPTTGIGTARAVAALRILTITTASATTRLFILAVILSSAMTGTTRRTRIITRFTASVRTMDIILVMTCILLLLLDDASTFPDVVSFPLDKTHLTMYTALSISLHASSISLHVVTTIMVRRRRPITMKIVLTLSASPRLLSHVWNNSNYSLRLFEQLLLSE
jgi:hypothetical protein